MKTIQKIVAASMATAAAIACLAAGCPALAGYPAGPQITDRDIPGLTARVVLVR